MSTNYQDLLIDNPSERVLRVTLNRPDARNALRTQTLKEIAQALNEAERDESIRCVILTGGSKVFAAGADVKEMVNKSAVEALHDERQVYWKTIQNFTKPLIAAVNGYSLGGGNELAMCCDIIIAGEDAVFGQPEIKLALIPGAGGTQRLTAALGKARAMKYILTGDFIKAEEAFDAELVSEVTPPEKTQERAVEMAADIAEKSPIAVKLAKEAVKFAAEGLLQNGMNTERKAFNLLFATEDRKEGVAAFLEKRKPEFKGK